ncbi:undecaprenyl-phosphate glucose phosphotransferase [bacterium]|nr:undecaprenyl-phosphate glucose phosphotransferase [bacterium]
MTKRRKEHGLFIPFLQVISDIIAIECAFLASYWLRFHSFLTVVVPVTKGFASLEVYVLSSCVVITVWLFIFQMNGLYGVRRNVSRIYEVNRIIKSVTIGILMAMTGAFLYRGYSFSRIVFFLIWVTSIIFITLFRLRIISYERARHRRGKDLNRAAIAGSSNWSGDILEAIKKNPGFGIDLVGYIGENALLAKSCVYLGPVDETARIIKEQNLDVVFLAPGEKDERLFAGILRKCIGLNVEFYLLPDIIDIITSRLRVEEMGGIALLKVKELIITGWNRVFKRAFDIVVSVVSLVLLSPLLIIIALVVGLTSKGQIFYRQERLGRDGREFDLIKFRSMRTNAEGVNGPAWTVKGDSRVTPAGKFLRRFSLDELPQLVNVLLGEMSLVGPRPERPHFVDKFKTSVPKYLERHRVKSGMTGWAQVNGLRGDVLIDERTKYDVYYVENWSFVFDIKIIIMTIWTVISGKNSY